MTIESKVLTGDCLSVMPTLDANSVDAIVTDPPYGLGFMGKDWDHGIPGPHFWVEALRVAKPGAHLVAFGGTRTFHRLTCAIENAGWEIRDCLSWLYGSGFPKSLNLAVAFDKRAGIIANRGKAFRTAGAGERADIQDANGREGMSYDGKAQSDLAKQWDGWGTALKPAWEPIILARKPFVGTIAANVQEHGTGALNIDGCRIATDNDLSGGAYSANGRRSAMPGDSREGSALGMFEPGAMPSRVFEQPTGRWPANVVLDKEAARQLDEQSGELGAGNRPAVRNTSGIFTAHAQGETGDEMRMDGGGASRFFYTTKAGRAEREAGLDDLTAQRGNYRPNDDADQNTIRERLHGSRRRANHHPTVKPLDLMQWLCRLVTPKGGLVLDPFCGSGTTGRAAIAEGFRFVGIELNAEYAEIACARILDYAPLFMDNEQ